MSLRTRTAARMFLVDPHERVLLVHDRVDLDRLDSHWVAPGGGVEGSETLVAAAVREVYEETGLVVQLPSQARPVFVERELFWFAGEQVDQTNHYFLARVEAGLQVRPTAPTAFETAVALGMRWWPLDELAASEVVRVPATMVEVIRQALDAGT
ncbi:MAG TPA: NUDIX domain-containing protein [Jatrophihabitans sp.]|nr:NUDIX domain-containing protein [Jatrophihabitans sp.]